MFVNVQPGPGVFMLKRPDINEAHHMFGPVGRYAPGALNQFVGIQHGVEAGNRGKSHSVISRQHMLGHWRYRQLKSLRMSCSQ